MRRSAAVGRHPLRQDHSPPPRPPAERGPGEGRHRPLTPAARHLTPRTAPLPLWLAIQLAALLLACLRVPLAAKYPHPAELFALHLTVLAQILTIIHLFPTLCAPGPSTWCTITTSWPFLALSGVLSAAPTPRLLAAAAYVNLWFISLALLRRALPTFLHPAAVATLSLLSVGLPVLQYLCLEFSPSDSPFDFTPFSPTLAALAQISAPFHWPHYLLPATISLLSLLALLRSRQLIHRS